MRIHNAYDTAFYIHVTSRAIIEDCDRVGSSTWVTSVTTSTLCLPLPACAACLGVCVLNLSLFCFSRVFQLGFAPYNWTYERLDEDFEVGR